MKLNIFGKQDGFSLVLSLFFLVTLTVVITIAMSMTNTDMKITRHFKSNKKAFYAAEAGVEEVRARMRLGAVDPIYDSHPDQAQWSTYIGTQAKAQEKGYDSSNSMHIRVNSIQSELDFVVKIVHQTDSAGNILYWGDANHDGINEKTAAVGTGMRNIYKVTSEGAYTDAHRTIEAEMARTPPFNVPAALLVGAPTTIQGTSTNIIGIDGCGGNDLPGIATTQDTGSITINGNPSITGEGVATPNISYNVPNMDVQALIDVFKSGADFQYTVNSATQTASTSPGPGDGWGTPTAGETQQSPSSCDVQNIVYYNTGGTYVRLSGGVSGCGILLVEGDIELSGGFSWYGPVIVSGSVMMTGGGNKNLTGAMLTGGSTDADLIGGNTNIVYCSAAVNNQTNNRPMQILSWNDNPTP